MKTKKQIIGWAVINKETGELVEGMCQSFVFLNRQFARNFIQNNKKSEKIIKVKIVPV